MTPEQKAREEIDAVFVELPPFARYRSNYLEDEVRYADARRGKGKRGGLRVIYFWWRAASQSGCSRSMARTFETICRRSNARA